MNPAPGPMRLWSVRVLVFAGIAAALHFAQSLFLPLVLAGLLCFLLAPLCEQFERWRFGRIGAVIATTLLSFSLIGGIAYVCATQLIDLADELPKYRTNLLHKVASLKMRKDNPLTRASETIEEVTNALNEEPEKRPVAVPPAGSPKSPPVRVEVVHTANDAWQSVTAVVGPVLEPLGQAAVIALLVVFMLLGREDLRDRLIHLIGRGRLPVTTQALDDAGSRVSRYLMAQLLVNASYGVPVGIGLHFIGLPNAMLWGLLATVLRFLPYIGPWLAAAFPLALSLAIFDSWTQPMLVMALFITAELISNNAIEPWLYGASTGLSPLAIIVSAVFWTWLWGGVGLVIATPLTVCLAVAGKHIPDLAFLDLLLGQKPPISESDRLYQRLLALDEEEAVAIVEKCAEESSLAETFDEVVLPALTIIDSDFRSDLASDHAQAERTELLRRLLAEVSEDRPAVEDAAVSVLCIPAARELDGIAALMLAQLLRERHCGVEILSAKLLAAESLERAVELALPLICICSLPPVSVLAAAQLCKRLRARLPDTRIVVALFQPENLEFKSRRTRLEKAGAEDVFSSFQDAAARLGDFATLKETSNQAGKPLSPASANESNRDSAL